VPESYSWWPVTNNQLRIQLRVLAGRVDALEAALAARPAKPTTSGTVRTPKRGYVNIPQAESDKHWNLWATYHYLKILETSGKIYNRRRGDFLPTSRAWFAANVRDDAGHRFSLRELERWFSPRNTFAVGSRQDVRIRRTIQREIDRLRSAGYYVGMPQQEIDRLHSTVM
jgi:hypothetical protein